MYRKHLRMARGKGEVEPRQGLRSHFVERMVKLPMVHVAWDYAANTYSIIKESNRLVNFTLTNAEKSVTFMAGQAKPVVMKFEKQIQAVDDLACKGLGTLEEKVPLITKRPEQIMGETRSLYTSTVYNRVEDLLKYGNDKVKSVTDYGLQTASVILDNPIINSLLGTVDGALVITENYIDYIMPPEEKEINNSKKKPDGEEKTIVITRLAKISSTIRRRGYRTITKRLRNVQQHVLKGPEVLITISLENFEKVNQYARSLWVALNSEEKSEEQKSQNFLMKHFLPIARPVVKRLVVLYISISQVIPLPAPKENGETNNSTNNNVDHAPAVVNTLTDGVLRIIGLIRTIPALLPMYIYVFFTWLNPEKEKAEDKNEVNTNSVKDEKPELNHVAEHDSSNDCSAENNVD